MGLLKNLLMKIKAEDNSPAESQIVQTFEPAPAAASAAEVSADEAASANAEKKQHGEPGVCCGSCH
ncbi:MAG: CCGSCS motif protein [Halomonas sp.]|uniref:CCGSCS motif protein n=1 Tax=Halomonas sp. TaxID=1486246 RepID=UPI0039706008